MMTVIRSRKDKQKQYLSTLKVKIKNFGPIFEGNIELKPLTVFIGPNNSGKSYAAMLIHSLLETYNQVFVDSFYYFKRTFIGDLDISLRQFLRESKLELKRICMEKCNIEPLLNELIKKKEIAIPQEIIDNITHIFYEQIFATRLNDRIVRSFACPLEKLVKIGEDSFNIEFGFETISCTFYTAGKTLITDKTPKLETDLIASIEESKYRDEDSEFSVKTIIVKSKISETETIVPLRGKMKKENKEELLETFIDVLIDAIYDLLVEKHPIPVYYLPAARSGILQGHKALAISMWEKVPFVGVKEIDIPKFSGVVSDFISSVISTPRRRGPFRKLAEQFEKELLHGTIEIKFENKYSYPEIRYQFQGTSIQLHRASSTVSEMAPISLYLKHIIRPYSILIIEEPEAHLHPENQRILAKYLVRLIRKGVKLLITTHSEYLLEQLSNFILLSKVEPQTREEKYHYLKNDFLKTDEVAAYVFQYNKDYSGYEIKEIEITDDGISQEEFTKIHEILYEELYKLQKELEDIEDS